MTHTLTKAQIEAIRVELAKYGLSVTVKRQATGELAERRKRLQAWRPRNGTDCKSAMLRTLTMVEKYGYSNDRYGWNS